ncbi:MAG: long-chain fatty acid--CoA ligase [Anaerolineales bacterium]|nr:long-chain fatty acid--CoA ligase [Anaerolineales bacterium]
MYIGNYLRRRELYTPDQEAFVDYGMEPALRLTYREANQRANRLANFYLSRGIGMQDRVAILARDGIEHLDSFFACGKIGAIHTALNWRLHWRENLEIIRLTRPRVMIISGDYLDDAGQILQQLSGSENPIELLLFTETPGDLGALDFHQVLESNPDEPVAENRVGHETIAALIFTGGTTGLPKAARISHRMIAWNTLNTVIHDIRHEDIYLNVFPLFHTGGLFVYTLPQVIFGGTTILIPRFDPERVLSLIEKEGVTVFAGVPTMYQFMTQAENWEGADLSSLRFCTSGGAPLPVSLVQQYAQEKKIRFKQGFGMTEFGPGIFALAPEDAISKAGSIGRPNFYVEALIKADDGSLLGPDQVGELVLKGPSFCSGYFNNPQATEEAVDEDGYFHTGDLAKYDSEGYFFIVGRKKDMFISGGENIYPPEIEKALYDHSAVHMCAVVGMPHPSWGEAGVACVVKKQGDEVGEMELINFLKDRLAAYKVPKKVVFFHKLPISGAGKVLKRELKDLLSKEEG